VFRAVFELIQRIVPSSYNNHLSEWSLDQDLDGSGTAWVVSIAPWVRTPWVVGQLWRGTDGVSRRRVAWTLVAAAN